MSELSACTYGLTLVQPWATAILTLGKDCENRSWAPPMSVLGKRIAVHAGTKLDKTALSWIAQFTDDARLPPLPQGAILGTVEVFGYLIRRKSGQVEAVGDVSDAERRAAMFSPWRNESERCQWLLRDPVTLSTPIPRKGALGLWSLTAAEVGHA